jgi:hypothetical protein
MTEQTDGYMREGDIILINSKEDKGIHEVKVTDISPSGDYIEVRVDEYNAPYWVHSNRYLETLRPADENDGDYVDVADSAQAILEKIRNRNGASPKPNLKPDLGDSDVIHIDQFTKYDTRNKRK